VYVLLQRGLTNWRDIAHFHSAHRNPRCPLQIYNRVVRVATSGVITSDKGGGKCFCPCSFVCLSVSKITQKNACLDLDEMLRVDRCRDMDELIKF